MGITDCSTSILNIKMKNIRYLFLLVSIQAMLVLYGVFYLNLKTEPHELRDKFTNEWHDIDGKTVFRSESAFYFTQKRLVTIIFASIKPKNSLAKFSCVISYTDNSGKKNKLKVPGKSKFFTNVKEYRGGTIFCELQENIRSVGKIYLKVVNENSMKNRKTNEIELQIKEEKQKSGVALSSKMYNLTVQSFNSFKSWIEINKSFGYAKIIIFNNSIPSERFDDYFAQHKNLVEIKPFKLLPTFYLTANESQSYLDNLKDISRTLRRLFERVAINQWLMVYSNLYNYISVFDYDEIIVPRPTEKTYSGKLTDLKRMVEQESLNTSVGCEFSIEKYIQNINEIGNTKKEIENKIV